MDRLMRIADDAGVALLEDAAHAHGSEWKGGRAGSFGAMSSFSFQNGKVMTAGEGGILLSNSEDLIDRAREILDTGRRKGEGWFFHYSLGSNYRITALQCAVLMAQLDRLPEQNVLRARNAAAIRAAVADVRGLLYKDAARGCSPYKLSAAGTCGWRSRGIPSARMVNAGFPCTPFYPHTLYENPLYQERRNCRVMPCPNAEQRIKDAFWIPHRALLGDEESTSSLSASLIAAAAGQCAAG